MREPGQRTAWERGPADQRASVAIDLGAESCRVSLLRWTGGGPSLQLVHRFSNGPERALDGTLRWPMRSILEELETGLQLCAERAPEGVRSLAVDGWAVDYVVRDAEGGMVEPPFCYRDPRNAAAASELHKVLSPERMREITGVEQQPLNTLYQLYADRLEGKAPAAWLNLPEYCLAHWGAEPVAEYTNATHTQMVDLHSREWSEEIFRRAGLDRRYAPRLVPPGSDLGKLSGALAKTPALSDTRLIAPACHDTASAIAGIAEEGEDWAYLSCGTWSLVGALLDRPLNSRAVQEDNFTNLGAVGGAVCFHKSVNGMWILKQCLLQWARRGYDWPLADLLRAAEAQAAPVQLLDVDDPALLAMGDMPSLINAQLQAAGYPVYSAEPEAAPKLTSLILHSLAARYAAVLERVRVHSGRELRRVVMVGGGAQNALLRRLTAERTQMEVTVGPTEASTIGNFAVQLAALAGTDAGDSVAFRREVVGWSHVLQRVTLS